MRVQYEKLADHLEEKKTALKNALDELNAKVNPVTVVGLGESAVSQCSIQKLSFYNWQNYLQVHTQSVFGLRKLECFACYSEVDMYTCTLYVFDMNLLNVQAI